MLLMDLHYLLFSFQKVKSADNIEEISEANWASKLEFNTTAEKEDDQDMPGRCSGPHSTWSLLLNKSIVIINLLP